LATAAPAARWPIHTLLVYAYPAIFLLSHNTARLEPSDVLRSLAVLLAVGAVVFVVAWLWLRDAARAGLIASLLLPAFYAVGPLAHGLGWLVGGVSDRFVSMSLAIASATVCLLVFGVTARMLRVAIGSVSTATRAANAAAAVLIAFPLTAVVPELWMLNRVEISHRYTAASAHRADDLPLPPAPAPGDDRPNVFVLLLDAYAGDAVLAEMFDYDNAAFRQALGERGFHVLQEAGANYYLTKLAITSMLNMEYLQTLMQPGDLARQRGAALEPYRDDNRAFKVLRQQGYEIVTFEVVPDHISIRGADQHVVRTPSRLPLSDFEWMLVNASPVGDLIRWAASRADAAMRRDLDLYAHHREWNETVLERLPELAETERRRFVFAHLPTPHTPFVFDREGRAIEPERPFNVGDGTHVYTTDALLAEYRSLYPDQLHYVNTRVIEAIDGILAASPEPPVVLVMSDHGSRALVDWHDVSNTCLWEGRQGIFAALLPGADAAAVFHEGITPVNHLRLLFGHLFGADYPALPDETWFALPDEPFDFIDATLAPRSEACERWPQTTTQASKSRAIQP
jgi:hypothetical protein